MKKNYVLALIVVSVLLIGCKKQDKQIINFNQRSASIVKEDGWIYLYYCEFDKNDLEPNQNAEYWFGGYNLKYKELDDYKITIRDDKTGQIELEASMSLPCLLHNENYSSELEGINKFLNEKKFSEKISKEDMQIEVHNIKKEDIVELHNKAIESDNAIAGKYLYLPEANIVQDLILDGYRWQVGYLILYGNIERVNIQLIYDDDTYLSDLMENDNASQEQQKVYNYIKQIEARIIKNQEFNQEGEQKTDCNIVDFERLDKLLKSLA